MSTVSIDLSLPNNPDVVRFFTKDLSITDVRAFERARKINCTLTSLAWKRLRQEHDCNFDWGACAGIDANQRDRWNYILCSALKSYMNEREHGIDLEFSQKTYKRLAGLFKKFPTFGTFIKEDLYEKSSATPVQLPNEMLVHKTEIRDRALEGWGGELTLQALLEVKNYLNNKDRRSDFRTNSIKIIKPYLEQAVSKEANCAPFFAMHLMTNGKDHMPDILNCIIFNIGKVLLEKNIEVLKNTNEVKGFKKDFITVYEGYDNEMAGFTLSKLELWYQAEIKFDRYFKSTTKTFAPPHLLANAGIVKKNQKKLDQAEEFLTLAVEKYGNKVPGFVLKELELVKKIKAEAE